MCAYCGRVTRRFDHRHGVYACSRIVSAQRLANGVLGAAPLVVTTCSKHAKEQGWTILK
jgi:hypothetical protein